MNKKVYRRLKEEAKTFMEDYNKENDVLNRIEEKINLKAFISDSLGNLFCCGNCKREYLKELKGGLKE
jgi:hypothetical protein